MNQFNEPPQTNIIDQFKSIRIEHLKYVERDLSFCELVSLGFLLYGDNRANAEFILQKLLVIANSNMIGRQNMGILENYARIEKKNWCKNLIEALVIIGSGHVLRKFGFCYEQLRLHFLPHIAELSLNIHPLLKALYKMCERMDPVQSGRLILDINEQYKRNGDHLRFYNFEYMEIFLLDWITRRIINIGDHNLNDADISVLISYFKLNEMDSLKMLLTTTIESNTEISADKVDTMPESNSSEKNDGAQMKILRYARDNLDSKECYEVRHVQAGIALIINQEIFHVEKDETVQHLLPKQQFEIRRGSSCDKDRLKNVFASFHYKVEEHENLTHIEMLHCIRETMKRCLVYDSLIVCILSHGSQGIVYGSNSVPVEIAAIERIITGETLQGKPKMLIIQACQAINEALSVVPNKKDIMQPSADAYADMIKAMSTIPGYISWRHSQTGSWFIQTLCDQLEKLGKERHILDILMSVTKEVTKKRGEKNEVMVPLTSHTLRKYFFLPSCDKTFSA